MKHTYSLYTQSIFLLHLIVKNETIENRNNFFLFVWKIWRSASFSGIFLSTKWKCQISDQYLTYEYICKRICLLKIESRYTFIYFYNNNKTEQNILLHETVETSIQMYRKWERGFCLIAFIQMIIHEHTQRKIINRFIYISF